MRPEASRSSRPPPAESVPVVVSGVVVPAVGTETLSVPLLRAIFPKEFVPVKVVAPLLTFRAAAPATFVNVPPWALTVPARVPFRTIEPRAVERVSVLVNPPRSSVAPLLIWTRLLVLNTLLAPKAKVPALTVVEPVNVLMPVSVCVPVPCFTRLPVPAMTPRTVRLVASPKVSVALLVMI